MSKLSLREIAQSQLDSTPVIDGQLIVCLDTGNAYRDTTMAHVKIGSDLEVVSDLPLAPLAEKLYYLKPNKLYSYLGGNWVLLNDDFSIKTNKSALNGDAKIILDGSKKTSVALKGSGVATVVTDSDGQLVVNSPDPNTILEHITNKEIDTMMGKIVVPDEDKSVTIDPSLSNPGQVADAKATGDAIREEVERAKKVENEIKNNINNRFASQNILIGTETGNPLSVDDAFSAPLCGLTVYGKSTQDGTPSPDNPVPIVSAGDGGSVAVKVTGKNLLNPSLFQNHKYQNFNVKTGYYEIDNSNDYWITGIQPCLPNTTYHLNVYTEGGCFYDEKKNVLGTVGFEFTIKTPVKCAYYCANFAVTRLPYGSPVIATLSESTTYSPYREQLLTLPTPTGLPGIPVTSGGNYTDPQGQQWVCDEVDLERGVKVQRIGKAGIEHCIVSRDPNWWDASKSYSYQILAWQESFNTTIESGGPCNLFIAYTFIDFYNKGIENGFLISAGESVFNISKSLGICTTPDEFKVWFNENVVLYKILATPIETPLTPAEIAAYKALTAYGPDTVVQAGDGAGVKLEYQRDVNIAIKRIEDAVASMT